MRKILLLLSGLLLAAAPAAHSQTRSGPPSAARAGDPHGGHIAEASQRFGIPAAWIRLVMRAESAGDPSAISPAGAIGLMQIMPATWAYLRARHGLGADPWQSRDNILAGTAYLRELYDRYGSPGFLAAYNAGPGRYEAYLAGRPLPRETRAYVASIAPNLGDERVARTTTAPAIDPFAWNRAPIFIGSASPSSVVASGTTEALGEEQTAAPSAHRSATPSPQSSALFVAMSDVGTPR